MLVLTLTISSSGNNDSMKKNHNDEDRDNRRSITKTKIVPIEAAVWPRLGAGVVVVGVVVVVVLAVVVVVVRAPPKPTTLALNRLKSISILLIICGTFERPTTSSCLKIHLSTLRTRASDLGWVREGGVWGQAAGRW